LLDLGRDALLKDWHGRTPVDLAANEDVKTAFAEHCEQADLTNENKKGLLLLFSRLGMASSLPAVLQAFADHKHTDEAGPGQAALLWVSWPV
jgi:hypothetical protein